MYNAQLGRWHVADPLSEKGYWISPFTLSFNNPLKYVDPDGNWPWENQNIKDARKLGRQVGIKPEIWKGSNGVKWASVTFKASNNFGVGVLTKRFPGTKEHDHSAIWNIMSSIDIPDGHGDPCNTGRIDREDAQVGGAVVATIVTGGAAIEAEGLGLLLLGILSTLNSADGITTNNDGSIILGQIDNKDTKEIVTDVKTAIDGASFYASAVGASKELKNVIQLVNDGVSFYKDIKNNPKDMNAQKKEDNE